MSIVPLFYQSKNSMNRRIKNIILGDSFKKKHRETLKMTPAISAAVMGEARWRLSDGAPGTGTLFFAATEFNLLNKAS